MTAPIKLEQLSPTDLAIHWDDGIVTRHHGADLRRACSCATCVDEWTGEKRLNDKSISEDTHPVSIRPTGNYALHIQWSDGHATGFYSFEMLRHWKPV